MSLEAVRTFDDNVGFISAAQLACRVHTELTPLLYLLALVFSLPVCSLLWLLIWISGQMSHILRKPFLITQLFIISLYFLQSDYYNTMSDNLMKDYDKLNEGNDKLKI